MTMETKIDSNPKRHLSQAALIGIVNEEIAKANCKPTVPACDSPVKTISIAPFTNPNKHDDLERELVLKELDKA
eukprot:Pgem_evm1s13658